jgi:general secretion pathway protein D
MEQVLDFIATFDVPYLHDKKLFLLRLTYWQADEFIAQLTKIMEGIGYCIAKKAKDPGLLFLPIKQLGAILAITPDDSSADAILQWKKRLDTPEAAGTGFTTYTYIPKYSRASDLLESIHNLYKTLPTTTDAETPQMDKQKKRATSKAKGMDMSVDLTRETSFEAPGLKMAADDRKNMILILSKPNAYHDLLNLLRTLDIPVRQVLIEATIVELTLTDELQYGVEWFIDNASQGGSYTLGTLKNLGLESMGLSYSFLSESGKFQSLVSALAEADKANILSTPRLIVLDNMEAAIQVGKDVPIITGEVSSVESSSSSSTNVYNTVEYRSTGVLLKVKPTINTDGLLTLDITQEVSDLSDTSGVSDSPIILTRKITTTIIAAHGQTIVLGGLMKENLTLVESKVPLLGDIPLLGNLFKHASKTKEKTELLVLVTPTILTNPDDAATVSNQLRRQLDWLE